MPTDDLGEGGAVEQDGTRQLVDPQAQVPQLTDPTGDGQQVGRVVAVAGPRVDPGGRQHTVLVVVPQHPDGDPGQPRELADGEQPVGCHVHDSTA